MSSKLRTMTICLSDIPEDKIYTAGDKKQYVTLATWDLDQARQYDHDFSVSIYRSKEDQAAGIERTYIGKGMIQKY